MNKEKILFIVTSTIVREIRDQGSNFRHETCKASLLPCLVTITKSIFSFYFAHYFLRIDQVNKEKNTFHSNKPTSNHGMVTSGREIRDQGSNFRYETCESKSATVLCYYIKSIFSLFTSVKVDGQVSFPL